MKDNKSFKLEISANYASGKSASATNAFINNLELVRIQEDYIIDFDIHGSPPFLKVPERKR